MIPTRRHRSSMHKGFSLIEMLMTITVLAVMVTIAIATYSRFRETFFTVQYQRNAQEIASVFATGSAAGIDFVVPDDLEATVRKVIQGEVAPSGPFQGKTFRVGLVDEDSVEGAMQFLTLNGAQLIYQSQ